jgi:hypothetical protein
MMEIAKHKLLLRRINKNPVTTGVLLHRSM